METLLVLAAVLIMGPALYALGRVHGRGDLAETYQSGHQAGWVACFRQSLALQRATHHTPRPARNTAGNLYRSTMPADPDATRELARVG